MFTDDAWQRTAPPWTSTQTTSLNAYQMSEVFHPYTCDVHTDRRLNATLNGWRCPVKDCDKAPGWAWQWTADNAWRAILEEAKA